MRLSITTNLKNTFSVFIFLCAMGSIKAQMYSEPKKVETKVEKTKKTTTPKDTSRSYMAAGFILNATASVNRGMSSGNYRLSQPYDKITKTWPSADYEIKNSFGYRIGIGIGFQSKTFALELPLMFCVDRFKVPSISSKDHLKVTSFEFGLNQYFKFLKEKHYILLGEYIATYTSDLFDFGDAHSLGLNFGYGYNILKRLSVSLRYKFNLFSFGDEPVVEIRKYDNGGKGNTTSSSYNSLQLVAKYDLVNTRKIKYKKKKEPKVNKQKDDYEYMNTQNNYNPPPPPKPTVDYTGYSDTDLNLALKEANSKSDLDTMLGIQKEIDKRKQMDEFSKFSNIQLEQELNKALDREDYKRAEIIKKEIAKRDTQKGMPSGNTTNDLESKSIEELTKLKDEAVQKEDYEKAKQIQDIINKKKP